jgi:hypothetical protein
MSKNVNIGGLQFQIADHDSSIGATLSTLQDTYEKGDLTALFVVYATKTSLYSGISGNGLIIPSVVMAANVLSNNTLNDIEDSFGEDKNGS